jgi:nicotinamide riboside kinase|tara:strand:+ start:7477 stop:8034 length:558 start_codon:yes stop_codon:yes gene_type:complete
MKHQDLIRVAISGSHATGKTTLVNDLSESLNRLGIKTNIAAEPIRLLDDTQANGNQADRFLRLLQIHFQRLSQEGCQCCIYDRSLLDFCVYLKVEGISLYSIYPLARELLPWYLPHFDAHIYLPIEFAMQVDDKRPVSDSFRVAIDTEIGRLGRACEIDLQTITGSRRERTKKVIRLIQNIASSK